MAARTDREAARAAMRAAFEKALEQAIPEDQSKPLYGETFQEWEQEADRLDQTLTPVLMEQRALLADSAEAEARHLGHCPHCGEAVRLYLQRSECKQEELQTPHGPAVLGQQSVRCRSCGRSFSPSGP